MTNPNPLPARGEVWEVRFDPSEGDEIKKIRPAIVMSIRGAGRMNLLIVVPITTWQPPFERYFWMINLKPTPQNGLSKESAADAFQVKSISTKRLVTKLGSVASEQVEETATAIALCIGYKR